MPDVATIATAIDTLVNMLPANRTELCTALEPTGVSVERALRDARFAGHRIMCRHGVFVLTSDLLAELKHQHEHVAYTRTRTRTTDAMYPDPRLAQAAELLQQVLDDLDAPLDRERRIARKQ